MKKNTKALALTKKSKNVLNQLEKEIQEEYIEKEKHVIKELIKNIKRAEITTKKLKAQLKDKLSGKKIYDEEEMLFE